MSSMDASLNSAMLKIGALMHRMPEFEVKQTNKLFQRNLLTLNKYHAIQASSNNYCGKEKQHQTQYIIQKRSFKTIICYVNDTIVVVFHYKIIIIKKKANKNKNKLK